MDNQQVSSVNLYAIHALDSNYYHDGNGEIYSTVRGGKLKKLKKQPHGGKTKKVYYRVKLRNRMWMVHHLVAIEKFNRLLNKGESVNHIDGNPQNNCPCNLEITTHAEQCAHAVQTGLYCSGEAWYKARGLRVKR